MMLYVQVEVIGMRERCLIPRVIGLALLTMAL